MSNNLQKLAKDLRAFAKRCKDIKYTRALLFVFLLTGLLSMAAPADNVETARKDLNTSITDMKKLFKEAKQENNKLMKGSNLELIQLMEQGDHVVKSPWSSWQYGMNYFYSDWRGTYKGRGDKSKENLNLARKTDPLERFKFSSQMSATYGTTDLDLVYEPPREVEVSAGIRPKEVNKQAPTFVPSEPSGSLPPFEPKIIQPPKAPEVTPPQINEPEPLVFGNFGSSISSKYYLWNDGTDGNDVMMKQVTLTAGKIKGKTGSGAYIKGLAGVAGYGTTTGATLTPGTLTGTTPADGMNNLNRGILYGIRDSAFMDWSDSVEISWFGDFGKPLIYMETGSNNGTNNTSLDHLYAAGTGPVSKDLYDEVKGYKTQSGLKELEGGSEGINLHNNRGKIYLGDSNTWYNATTVLNSRRLSVLNNQGSITGLNINNGASGVNGSEKQVVFFNSPDYDNDTPQRWIFANGKTGKINMYGKQSLVMYYTSDDGTRQSQNETAFINEGEINLYGIESSGVMISGTETLKTESGFYLNNPINIYSDSSRGVYIAGNISNVAPTQAIVRVHIGKGKNDTTGVDWTDIETGTVTKIDSNGNDTVAGSTVNMVDNSIGVMYTNANTGAKIQAPDITMEKFARKSIGILTTDGKLTVSNGNININGGEGNVALYAKGGEIVYNGNVTIGTSSLSTTGGNNLGKGNIGIFAENGHKVTLNGVLKTHNTDGSTRDGIGIYANNSDVSVTQAVDMKYEAGTTGESVGIYSKGPGTGAAGKTVTILGDGSKINIDGGTTNKGTALYSGAGGKIVADSTATNGGLQVTVTNGASAIASDGTNSNVSAKFSNIDYSGEGYALYTSSNGKIDVTGSKISLRGNATGFERDVAVATSPITFTDGTNAATITAFSNDVTIMNLRNVPALTLSTLNTNLQTYTGGITHSAGTDPVTGEVYNKYKTAAVDGLSAYNIDTDLDKSIATDDANATTNDYVFTRRMAVQRGIINLKAGKNVKAILSTTDLTKIGETSVVGLSMNSSSYATSNAEAGINLEANTTVTADRTTAGDGGAVGLYINYGKINTDASSIINVEKETSNSANGSAVGIYSVNGSEVTNAGQVNVGGQNSIGILGLAYRIDLATPNEFGTAALGQGTSTVLNKGQVSLDGANATGIYIKNNNASATRATAVGTNDTTGVITLTGDSSTGMSGDKATLENKGTININGQKSVGMFAKNSSELTNSGTINLAAGLSESDPNIGIYTKDADTNVTNSKDIIGGNNTYGIYGKTVSLTGTGKIELGDASVGIFSDAEYTSTPAVATIDLANGSKLKVGAKESVGVFATGKNQNISSKGDIEVGDSSFAFVVRGTGTTLKTDNTNGVTLGNDATFIYSNDTTGNIENKTALTATGSKNYGIYAAGTATNLANMNFGTGVGNVGMYSIGGGTLTNGSATVSPTITVSASDVVNKLYGIGMAAGYVNDAGTLVSTGNVVNYGTIKVEKDNGIGMFATGSGSTATNRGTIELSGKKTTGMYLDNNAIGYNYGTITTVPNPSNDGIVGVVASNGAIIKNYGTINIVDGSNLTGVFINKGTQAANYDDQIPGGGTGVLNGPIEVKKQSATGKTVAGINIVAPGNGTATIYRDGAQVIPVAIDTNVATPKPTTVNVGTTPISLTAVDLATPSLGQASSIGMYVDTSGVNYTNPIQGLNKLTGLQKVDLFFGTEASKYTNEKDIEVGKNILKPYNDVISALSSGTSVKFSFASGSLTWIATATQNTDDTLKSLYLSKIPYTSFSSESNTNKFLDGLEQRYGVEGIGTREKALFDKLNGIGKGEAVLFAQAVDQMKGHQYSNVQQRIQATGNVLNKEFDYLRNSWSNSTKDSNKIKVFGNRGEYNTDTAGVIDYVSNAYGVAYVHENETVKLGNSSGWYAGAVTNRFKFKDIGKSTENQTMLKLGIFKTMSPVADHNGSLQWTISGEGYVARNAMHRKYLVVDDIFNAKSDYTTYGVAVKNELGYNIRTSERTSIRPYGSLKLEYGRFGNIKEKSGEMRLEVKENDYYSVKPEVGIEFKYKQPMAVKTTFTAALGLGYENELGKVGDVNNKARVGYTNADWYNLRGEKEDRKGNFKADLNIGVDNTRFGVTFNAGYDTKGHNVRGGLGFRVIY